MKMNIVIIALCLAFFADAIGQTNQIAMTTDSVVTKDVAPAPAANEIVTRTGAIYERAEILKVEPDGLTIGYVPPGGGMGMIKIPLADLSGDFQTKYGYDYEKALEYQKEQQKEIGRWREKMIADEAAARAKRETEEKEAQEAQEAAEKEAAEKAANAATIQATNSPSTNAIPQQQNGGY